jgi:hypothetical protein
MMYREFAASNLVVKSEPASDKFLLLLSCSLALHAVVLSTLCNPTYVWVVRFCVSLAMGLAFV